MAKDISLRKLGHYWPLYLLVLPSALLVGVFAYYPAANAMFHAFYRWNGDYIKYFVGLAHFRRALGAPLYWGAALALVVANITLGLKKGPVPAAVALACGIVAPVVTLAALARLGQLWTAPVAPWRQALWPLVFSGGAMLAVWLATDRDSQARPLWLLGLGVLLAAGLLRAAGVRGVAAGSAALLLGGAAVWLLQPLRRHAAAAGLRVFQSLLAMSAVLWALAVHAGGDATLWAGFGVTVVLIVANIVKMLPSILTAVVIHRLKSDRANYWYRVLFVVPMIIPGMVYLLMWKFFFEPNQVFNVILRHTGVLGLLAHLDRWFGWGGVFQPGVNPVWLGSPRLVLPAMILWGFPWVGVVGVLIYLAGLQSIDASVYEAADLDGVTPMGKFLHIELPLILTQVRINLVLMIIGTLQSYGFILILFGDAGGPNGKLLVPGLYMFRSAFIERYVGYACCLGLIMFVFILILTEINNRYLRVEK
jgi:raffinose/stachyose/melibiose transport system permease protein